MIRYVIRFSLSGDTRRYEMPCEDAAAAIGAARTLMIDGHHVERIIDLEGGSKMVKGDEAI
jgi:hypothetical protein